MRPSQTFFPKKNRNFPGKRWCRITLRSLHLCGICGVVGGAFFDVPEARLNNFLMVTVFSGIWLILTDLYTNGIWLIQNRGWTILLKILIFTQLALFAPYERWVLLGIVILSGVVSHAPSNFRYYSIYHRKRVEFLN